MEIYLLGAGVVAAIATFAVMTIEALQNANAAGSRSALLFSGGAMAGVVLLMALA